VSEDAEPRPSIENRMQSRRSKSPRRTRLQTLPVLKLLTRPPLRPSGEFHPQCDKHQGESWPDYGDLKTRSGGLHSCSAMQQLSLLYRSQSMSHALDVSNRHKASQTSRFERGIYPATSIPPLPGTPGTRTDSVLPSPAASPSSHRQNKAVRFCDRRNAPLLSTP